MIRQPRWITIWHLAVDFQNVFDQIYQAKYLLVDLYSEGQCQLLGAICIKAGCCCRDYVNVGYAVLCIFFGIDE